MDYLPIFIDLRDKPVLIVGGGEVALRRARQMIGVQAQVTIVAPEFEPSLLSFAEETNLRLTRAAFEPSHIDGMKAVIAATDDAAVNAQVSALANARDLLVNVVDQPELCNFIMPAFVDRDPMIVAISSQGTAPVLARSLRAQLETLLPTNYGALAELMGSLRGQAKARFPNLGERRRFWEGVVNGPIAEDVAAGRMAEARAALEQSLADDSVEKDIAGEVALVGGGPGDPDLLTFRALRVMQQADCVIYDRLVAPAIVDLCRRDAERIYVGKKRDQHTVPQEQINELLVSLAQQGQRVVRLKGGDPFLFGRGGEEIDTLSRAGIRFQVIPGITSASGCAAYAGIPLTHRDYAHSCVFVTGHARDGKSDVDWKSLVAPRQTLCVYMGVHSAPLITEALLAAGMAAEMPAAVVENGTLPEQRVVTGTLTTLAKIVEDHAITPPAMIIIGEVVQLEEKLHWYSQDRPKL